jgi:hypothetical protein
VAWLRASAEDTWRRATLSLPCRSTFSLQNSFVLTGGACLRDRPSIQVNKELDYVEHTWSAYSIGMTDDSSGSASSACHRAALNKATDDCVPNLGKDRLVGTTCRR